MNPIEPNHLHGHGLREQTVRAVEEEPLVVQCMCANRPDGSRRAECAFQTDSYQDATPCFSIDYVPA
jgi:hypothetical protein